MWESAKNAQSFHNKNPKWPKLNDSVPLRIREIGLCTVGRISHGTFWFQHALFQNFLKSIYSFPWTLWIFLRWFRGRANHELLIYYINFNPTERILCLKHEKRNKRFKLVGTKTFAAECTYDQDNAKFVVLNRNSRSVPI